MKQNKKENEVKINELQAELDNEQNRAVTSDMFFYLLFVNIQGQGN